MDLRSLLAVAALATLLLAGCLAGDDAVDHDAEADAIGEPIVVDHDHNDVTQHTGSHNLDFVGWSTLGVELGENGFANFVLWQDEDEKLAFVAIDGDSKGGFAIADVSDPANIGLLGTYRVPGNGIQEVRVTPSGDYAVMNVQNIPSPDNAPEHGLGACEVCIHVVDVRDRSSPELISVTPVELLGTHNFHFEEYDDGLYLFAVGQPLNAGPVDPGNHVWIYRFVEVQPGTAVLVQVGSLEHDYPMDDGRAFPHDVMVQDHPATGQKIAYVSYWDGGHVLFDVTDPMGTPPEIAQHAEAAPSDALAIHWIWQEEWVRGPGPAEGQVIAWSAPEIGSLDSGSGVIRALDVTVPESPTQVGTWGLPGDVTIPGIYMMSPHTVFANEATGLVAVSHYHAGVWILDGTDPAEPQHLAYYLPHGDPDDPYGGPIWWKKPNFDPDGYGPNVYQVRWDPDEDSLLWITDRGTGLYALEYTGPVPGPLSE